MRGCTKETFFIAQQDQARASSRWQLQDFLISFDEHFMNSLK